MHRFDWAKIDFAALFMEKTLSSGMRTELESAVLFLFEQNSANSEAELVAPIWMAANVNASNGFIIIMTVAFEL